MTPVLWAFTCMDRRVQSPGGIGGQCVDLVNMYLLDCLQLSEQRLDATDWRNVTLPRLSWVNNAPRNYPDLGDIVVWSPSSKAKIGPQGHIAICMAADVNRLLTLDQNWPEGSAVSLVWHSYVAVAGWLENF